MNPQLIGELIRLRYKLLWAKTRSRTGRIALLLLGYLIFIMVLLFLTAGGFGAALLAVRSGKAELVAQIALTAIFFQSLLSTVIMGFGLDNTFSDVELRRYPVRARERRLARHLVGIADPFWFLGFALELGLAVGLYVLGATDFWQAVAAVFLLFVTTYVAARVLALLIARAMESKAGSVVLMGAVITLLAGLGPLIQVAERNHGLGLGALQWLRYIPTFAAATAATASGLSILYGFALMVWWLLGLSAALVALEKHPPQKRAAAATSVSFADRYDRVVAWFGMGDAPLVAHWLRYYARNGRVRAMYVLSIPLLAMITAQFASGKRSPGLFVAALGTFPMAGCVPNARFALNQYGHTGGGFRRLFLLPIEPAATLRAGSLASVLLNCTLIPVAGLVWLAAAPVRFDPRAVVMLMGSAVTGLFAFHGLALWSTLFGPRRADYSQKFGNDLSVLGTVVMFTAMFSFLFAPTILARSVPAAVQPDHWWLAVLAAAGAFGFYIVSLRTAGAMMTARREQLMAVVEGRS